MGGVKYFSKAKISAQQSWFHAADHKRVFERHHIYTLALPRTPQAIKPFKNIHESFPSSTIEFSFLKPTYKERCKQHA